MISSENGVIKITESNGQSRIISEEEIDIWGLDRSRRATLGPNWRSLIPPSDPSYRPPNKGDNHANT